MKYLLTFLLLGLLFSCQSRFSPLEELRSYDLIWDSPSLDYNGTMPLGNGELGANVWMEESGDLLLYISRTDTWGDNSRLLKVGKVRVRLDPAPEVRTGSFSQRLNLAKGRIEFSLGSGNEAVKLQVRVDARHPAIIIDAESSTALKLTAGIELWRNEPYELPSYEVSDVLLDRKQPDQKHGPMVVEPDVILSDQKAQIGWYHFNQKSVGPEISLEVQGLSGFSMQDPILHRCFGALIRGSGGTVLDDKSLQTQGGTHQELQLVVLTEHPSSPEEWLKKANAEADLLQISNAPELEKAHVDWWEEFWLRSWIFARVSDTAKMGEIKDVQAVNQGYILQRFINACNGRGGYPIKFNGSIFTVPSPEGPGDADYRRWGPGYWWQNTRLPYLSMCTSGDFEMLKPLFNLYAGTIFELSKYRTKTYFGFDGAYFAECTNFWGTVFSESYGWTPMEEREDPLQVSGYHKWEWVAGPELTWMMLDYYEHTEDNGFLQDTLLPVAKEVMRFFENFYETNAEGKLVMYPAQALETWWDCTNPMPELAGLIAVSERLLNLPETVLNKDFRDWLRNFRNKLPDLPLRLIEEELALAPAERFSQKSNIENPELYAVFPFRLVSLEKANVDWGLNAFNHRWDKGNFGWRQEEIFMAYLGLAEEAQYNLIGRAKNHDKNSRFPGFWGPNYDWVPDQDHGGVLLKAFQSMLIQTEGKKIMLLPAWPANWSAEFKLHAPYQTTITGTVQEGKLVKMKVSPKNREKDVLVLNN